VTTSLQVLSAGVMRRIVTEVAAAFDCETGYAVNLTVGTVGALRERAVGPLPPTLQKVTTYAAGLSATSAAREPARALIAYLARPALRPKLAAAGLDYRT
jgi:molybdate transport system substrate-binding protein